MDGDFIEYKPWPKVVRYLFAGAFTAVVAGAFTAVVAAIPLGLWQEAKILILIFRTIF